MTYLMTFLYIILFLVCLSILIIIHELGHLTAAKVFKVYCLEFSCGMGPLLWKYKRKGGETQLSLRAIPFGGYVSMYGEGVTLPEGLTIEKDRSLNNIKPWKKGIILVAGVFMNAVLALFVFFFDNVAFTQNKFVYANEIDVIKDSPAYVAGLKAEDILAFSNDYESDSSFLLGQNVREPGETKDKIIPSVGTLVYNDLSTKEVGLVLTPQQSFKNPVYTYTLFPIVNGSIVTSETVSLENAKTLSIDIVTKTDNSFTSHPTIISIENDTLQDTGIRIYVKSFKYNFGEAIGQSFVDFGNSSTAIVDSLVGLFTGQVGADQISGIVGVGFEAKNILDNFGISTFIYLWGLISVNLAIFNLLPFPGLDGWQLLVLIVESVSHKKMPEKVANIISYVGVGLLLVLMVGILFKDIWVYIIKGLLGVFIL